MIIPLPTGINPFRINIIRNPKEGATADASSTGASTFTTYFIGTNNAL